jgi:H+/Cl- antiporter ClcA
VGTGWSVVWVGSAVGAFAVVGAAAVLAVTPRAALLAVVLTVELTGGLGLALPMAVAVATAATIGRRLPDA